MAGVTVAATLQTITITLQNAVIAGDGLVVSIGGVDRTDQIDRRSFTKTEALTKEPDTLAFMIRNYTGKTYKPSLEDEVQVYWNGNKIFGGSVVEVNEDVDGMLQHIGVKCKDYTHLLDKQLVAQAYEDQTVKAIIDDILSNHSDGTFTTVNATSDVTINKITFNYMTISQCLQKMTEALGNYDWYVDYDKDIHFFKEAGELSPFNLNDTGGKYVWNSLKIANDLSQLRNKVVIRGGDITGTAVQNDQVADGEQRVFFVGYNLDTFTAEKALAASPTVFAALTVGADGKDDPASFDTLYNPNRGLLTFPDGTKPAVNDIIRTNGTPVFPLVASKEDTQSVDLYGTFEYVIVDKTIKSRDAASQRASAELLKYGNPVKKASWRSYSDSLRTGHTISIASTLRSITSQAYKVVRIRTLIQSHDKLKYMIEATSSLTPDLVDLLNKLLVKDVSDQIDIGENEVIDTLFDVKPNDTITLDNETSYERENYGTSFVLTPYTPDISGVDTKRPFILDGSPLT